jgi:hypothetical protein
LSAGNALVFHATTVAPVEVKMPCDVTQPGSSLLAFGISDMSSFSSISWPWKMKRPPVSTRSHSGCFDSTIALILA